ncbi:DNA methyltransferase [Candidatus Sordicultor fermentans]|uniref:DNA methyltransferase n=1 Tax=Candidatus Sordicultor fermentans TaxID=1953203 RepID=UPI0016BCD028|nr:site-specific DNA-methyltransferase [Candidatus Atribacteria bacterium]
MSKEQKFYDALKDIFIGARVEGESGYINLMRIKSRYYEEGVFPQLQKDIDKALEPFPEFREELFDKLYTFFNRYFSESGSIYFRYTPIYQNVYEKVYTDDKDVMLFWKTHMLYYVKTDRLFKNLEVDVDDVKFFFDVSTLEHKKANEKRAIIYELKGKRNDGVIAFNVLYSERGRKTKINDILRDLRKEGVTITEDTLEEAFRVFEKQSEVDYFINKNAKEFLQEQFNIWLYQYVFSGESEWTEKRIKQLQVLKDIAFKIVNFISQFEDELVKIWNKPKFALNSNYVITLDRIAEKNIELIEKILEHEGFENQVKEWEELGIVGKEFDKSKILENAPLSKQLNKKYQYLPIDTKYFKDLELEILGLFDDLDNSLDGWLIKSENYQALNTILAKFRGKVKCTYIDPPYNSKSTEIIYVNTYKHSSWMSLMENRLALSKLLSTTDGSHIIAIDENEQERLGWLLSSIFSEYTKVCVTVIHNKKGIQGDYFSYNHDYAYFCIPPSLKRINEMLIPQDEWEYVNLRKWGTESERKTAKNCFYPILVKESNVIGFGNVCSDSFHPSKSNNKRKDGTVEVYPIDPRGVERKWRYSRDSVEDIRHLLRVHITKRGEIQILKAKASSQYKTVWDDSRYIAGDYGTRLLTEMGLLPEGIYTKSIYTVMDSVYAVTDKDSIVLDYFAGSGTTAHAVINLNRQDNGKRKYILVEMADYFDTVLMPRIKKVVFSDKWKDGKMQNGQGISHFIKYYSLEQYEDTLRKVKYEDSNLFDNPYQDPYNQYVFMRDLKMLEALEIDYENNKVKVDLSKLYPNIDIPETLSNLLGKWIKKITPDYVEFEDGEQINLKDLDYKVIKPLIWW